ncbi:MAG: gluconate 2-dehydrogenase subunit 3 family protein [Bacteroidales bacterium]|nr:gluconate 2-dehydrogenase subunit 3 family protein [Bacteroidales bacterium]
MKAYTRRDFVRISAACTGSLLLVPGCRSKRGRWFFFTDEEALQMGAIVECLIPTDDFPGAKEADVINFMDKQLVGYYRRHQNTYRVGLTRFNESCMQRYGKNFNELDEEKKNIFLKLLEENKLDGESWKEFSSAEFFNLVLDHTMQGFYGSPRHGGNKDYISYRMLQLDYPLIIGRNKY